MSQRPLSRSPASGELSLYTPSLRCLRVSSGSGAVKSNARTESEVVRGRRERNREEVSVAQGHEAREGGQG